MAMIYSVKNTQQQRDQRFTLKIQETELAFIERMLMYLGRYLADGLRRTVYLQEKQLKDVLMMHNRLMKLAILIFIQR